MKKKPTDMIPVWGRVPYKHIERIERSLPRYGWRARLIAHVVESLANELEPASRPSMHTLEEKAEKVVKQYAHAVKKRKS